jgi:hypothetical protein
MDQNLSENKDLNNYLEFFSFVHNKPLQLGTLVKVSPENDYASDWPETYVITGLNWDPKSRRINITIADNFEDGGSDGWTPDDLIPVNLVK